MDYTPEQKRQYIQYLGKNPDEWDLDDSFTRWVPATKPQPSIADTTNIVPPPAEKTSALETFGKTALTEVVPTAASFGAGIGLPALAGSVFGPVGTLGGLALGLTGAIAGNILGRKIQEPFLPDSLQESVAIGREEHPIASALGGFAPALAAFNPVKSIGQLPSLAAAAGRGLRGGTLANQEIAGLQNLAVNTGVGAGMAGYNELADEEPGFDIGRFALQTGLGGLLNEPTKLGRKIGFRGTEDVPSNYIPGVVDRMSKEFELKLAEQKAMKAALDKREADALAARNEARLNNPEADVNPQRGKVISDDRARLESMKYRYQELHPSDSPTPDAEVPLDPTIPRVFETNPALTEKQMAESRSRGIIPKVEDAVTDRGRPVRGAYAAEGRTSFINRQRATEDTIPHEEAHGFFSDLRDSSIPGDKELYARFKENEESIVSTIGEERAMRQKLEMAGKTKDKAGLWIKDFVRNIKMKLGVASDEEAIKFIAQRIKYDAPYGSRREFLSPDVVQRATEYGKGGAAKVLGAEESAEDATKLQPELRNYDPNWRVTVQNDQIEGGKTIPSGYVQVDFPDNSRSTNMRKLMEEGFAFPVTEAEVKKLPQGQYTMKEVVEKMRGGKVKLQEDVPSDETPEGYEPIPKNYKEVRVGAIAEADFVEREVIRRKLSEKPDNKLSPADKQLLATYAGKMAEVENAIPVYKNKNEIASRLHLLKRRLENYDLTIDLENGNILHGHEKTIVDINDLPAQIQKEINEFQELGRKFYDIEPPAKEGEQSFALQEDDANYRFEKFEKQKELQKVKHKLLFDHEIYVKKDGSFVKQVPPKEGDERWGWESFDTQNESDEVKKLLTKYNRLSGGLDEEQSFSFQDDTAKSIEAKTPKEHKRYGFFKFMESAIDKVRRISPEVADASERFFARRDQFGGQWRGLPMTKILESKATDAEMREAYDYVFNKMRGKDVGVSEKAKKIAEDILKPTWAEIREAQEKHLVEVFDERSGKKIKVKKGEYFAPQMLSDDALQLFTAKAASPEARQAREEWAKYVEKESSGEIKYEDALKNIREYTRIFGGNKLYNADFTAVRKAQDYGVPESLRETNLLKVVSKYGRRAAQDIAYRRELQDNPKVAAALRLPLPEGSPNLKDTVDDITPTPEGQNLLKFIFNDWEHTRNPKVMAATRSVVSGLLGGATGIRNTVATIANTAPYISSTKDVVAFVKALGNLSKERLKSIEMGARSGTMDLDRWMTLESPDKVTDTFNKFSEIMRKYQGRDLLENFDRLYAFSLGKELAKNAIARGDKAFLKKFGTLVDKPINEIGEAELDQIAKNFVDRTQGTYDARGLPAGSFEGPLAPFLALSRWSIEKSNVIYKDVITPAITGENFKPLLAYTLGSLLTGTAIRELNELMSGKKAADASLGEAYSEKNPEHFVAAVISLAQLGGYAGIVFDVAKGLSDIAVSHETPRGLAFPLVDFATDTIGQGVKDYMTSVDAGANPFDAAKDLIWDIIKSSVQNVRLLDSRVVNSENTDRTNKFRDARVYKKLQGEEVPSMDELRSTTRYGQDEVKDFKRASSVSDALQLLPQLISKAIEKSAGDPYKLKAELRRIKQNNYQTLPNPTSMPQSFLGMISFLSKTQGVDAASERLMDYIQQNGVNKAKASLVP